jgi:pyruvate/2-oxoglutarate dehydrogenase complex dihydrolipoamide dehydrogenase (E3) component
MAETLKPDICVIGGGPGAAATAMAAAAMGVPAVLVEPNSPLPDHRPALLAAAKNIEAMRSGAALGGSATIVGADFAKVRAHVQRAAAALAPDESRARLTGLGVRVIDGAPRFKDKRTLTVGEYDIRARRFLIATGAAPEIPQIPGLDQSPYLTGDNILDLTELPGRLIVLGAGTEAIEFAQAFRRFGSEVTVLAPGALLHGEDEECASIVFDQLARDGVVIRDGVKVARIERASGSVRVILDGTEEINGTHLLVATGRKANVSGLTLEAASIALQDSGVKVDNALRTSNKRVYAIGAAIGLPRAANHHAALAIRNALFRAKIDAGQQTTARVVLTEPELAQVGLTEAEARKRGIKTRIARWPYHDNRRAQAEQRTHGHIKVVTTTKGKIVGVTIVGAQAGELVAPWALAVAQESDIVAFTALSLPSPTLSEIGKSAAIDFFVPRLTGSWTRRIISWLRIFG